MPDQIQVHSKTPYLYEKIEKFMLSFEKVL